MAAQPWADPGLMEAWHRNEARRQRPVSRGFGRVQAALGRYGVGAPPDPFEKQPDGSLLSTQGTERPEDAAARDEQLQRHMEMLAAQESTASDPSDFSGKTSGAPTTTPASPPGAPPTAAAPSTGSLRFKEGDGDWETFSNPDKGAAPDVPAVPYSPSPAIIGRGWKHGGSLAELETEARALELLNKKHGAIADEIDAGAETARKSVAADSALDTALSQNAAMQARQDVLTRDPLAPERLAGQMRIQERVAAERERGTMAEETRRQHQAATSTVDREAEAALAAVAGLDPVQRKEAEAEINARRYEKIQEIDRRFGLSQRISSGQLYERTP